MPMLPMTKQLIILKKLFETGSLTDQQTFNNLREKLNKLGRMLNSFIHAVEEKHMSPK